MKKILALCLAAAMLLTACGGKKESSLYTHGLELVELMGEMTQSDAYYELFSPAAQVREAATEAAEAARMGRYQTPKAVYRISDGEGGLDGLLAKASQGNVSFDGMSKDLKAYVQSRILGSLASILNSQAGTEALAASSIFMCSKSFVCDEASENTAYLYTYEEAPAVLVTFLVGEGHAVYASGAYVLDRDITDGDSLVTLFGFTGLRVELLESE
ncbi:MAG: hypothetical protein HFI64_09480 [Lachnospiraceae bacterium]|nr:hypothetical protein [Lachnospiraceae bacterium]